MKPFDRLTAIAGLPRNVVRLASLIVSVILLCEFPARSRAQTVSGADRPNSTAAQAANDEKAVQLDKFVVEGSLAGQAKAISMEKESSNLVNVISADKLGTFPDLNAAEALRRLPGVSLFLSSGEGRFISIRGARPNYNGTLINGFTVPAGDRDERRVDLQTISNALIQRIEVTKAATPDMAAEGIGGITNIVLANPLEDPGTVGRFSAYYGDNEYNGYEFRTDASYASFIGQGKKYAFQVAANYRRSKREAFETTVRGPTIRAGSAGTQVYMPGSEELKFLMNERYNRGGSVAFGARLGDRTEVELRAFNSRFWSPSTRTSLNYTNLAPVLNAGVPVDLTPQGGLVTARLNREWRTAVWNQQTSGIQLRSRTKISDSFKLEVGFSFLRNYESYDDDTTLPTDPRIVTEPYRLRISPEALYFTPTGSVSSGALDPAGMRITSWTFINWRKDEESESVPLVNLAKEFKLAGNGVLEMKAGFFGRIRQKRMDIIQERRNQLAVSNLTFADLGTSRVMNDYDHKGIVQGPFPVYDTAFNFVRARDSAFAPSEKLRVPGFDASDFAADEKIYAGYLMGTYKNSRITLIAGARYEKTEEAFTRLSTETTPALRTFTDSYNHLMPSAHLKYTLRKDMFLRASWTNTVARPDAQSIYGTQTVDRAARRITVPNPGLKALTSRNFDVSAEWYSGPLGQFAVGYFSKDIDHFPFAVQDTVTFEGSLYTRTQTQPKASGKIRGWEASLRQNLKFLPTPFDGLGFEFNVAKLDSEINSPIRPDRPRLEIQPERIINTSVYFAYRGLFVRVAVADQGAAVDRSGTSTVGPQLDRYNGARRQWDMTATCNLPRNFQLFAEWRNITNAPDKFYFANPANLAIRLTYGSQVGAGVRFHF